MLTLFKEHHPDIAYYLFTDIGINFKTPTLKFQNTSLKE